MKKYNLIKLLATTALILSLNACSNKENKEESKTSEIKQETKVSEVKKEEAKTVEVKKETPKAIEVKEETKKEDMQVNLGACKGCHGANFEVRALGKSKVVANMTKDEVSNALVGYKNGTYGGSMKGIMKGQVAKYSLNALKNTGLGK